MSRRPMLAFLLCAPAAATELHGYFRLAARPDLIGGAGRLGATAESGRLLNEGPWGLLDVKQPLVGTGAGTEPWGDLRLRVEGGGLSGGEPTNGSLLGFRLSQIHMHAGNLGVPNVEWRVGTLETTFGDLWLYDARPTQLLTDVLGGGATWNADGTELVVGVGDAGYARWGASYRPMPSGGGSIRHTWGPVTAGLGGQVWGLPPSDAAPAASAWKATAHLGYTGAGVVRSARLQATAAQLVPDPPPADAAVLPVVRPPRRALPAVGHELLLGAEAEFAFGPVEAAWGALLTRRVGPTTGARTMASTVARAHLPVTRFAALLVETSLFRDAPDGARPRVLWQGKGGLVLSPAGTGLAARPALRFLYGAEHAGGPLPDARPERWHHLVSVEAEAWF